jgi:hypothetical protein
MVERGDGVIPTIEQDTIVEAVAKAFHGGGIRSSRR